MSVVSSRVVQIQFSGDITENVIQSALDNPSSHGMDSLVSLAIGTNVINPPAVAGFTVTGLTIIPPAGNTIIITLKGIAGDSGIPLHITDPTSIGLGAGFSSLVLSVSVACAGVRLIWT